MGSDLNPFKHNGISKPILIGRIRFESLGCWVHIFFNFIQILNVHSVSNSGEADQTPRSVASGLVLHCSSTSHKKDARLIVVKCVLLAKF